MWLKENTPRLPIEINNEANNEYLKYKSLIFKKELPSEETEKIKPFYNILPRVSLLLLVTWPNCSMHLLFAKPMQRITILDF